MGTLRFAGVVFQVYSHDHLPRHVHGRYGGISVVVEIWPKVKRSGRKEAVSPANAKRSDVRYIVSAAKAEQAELNRLWEATHDA